MHQKIETPAAASRRVGAVRAFARSQRGGIAVMFALMLPLFIGFAGLGVETSYWYLKSRELQAQADAAAYAGAMEKRAGSSASVVTTVATRGATDNGFNTTTGTITVNSPPLTGGAGTSAVEVLLHSTAQRFFSAFFSHTLVNLNARAVGKYVPVANACILALDTTASKSAWFSGSSNLTLTACSVMANSTAADAAVIQGAALVNTACLISAGGVSVTAGLTETVCAAPMLNQTPVADPYAAVPAPTATGSCLVGAGATRAAGRYCSGMTLNSTVAFAPGVYYISGGDLTINANANLTGSGVTFYLASGSHLTMNGNATVNLSAPTSGTYGGLLFFGDRAGVMATNRITGNTASLLTGAIYFPSQLVDYQGNFSGTNGCTQIVADKVTWSGAATITGDCSAYGIKTIAAFAGVKLVE